MELVVKVQDDKAAEVAELILKMAFVEAVEIKLPPTAAESEAAFLPNTEPAVPDADKREVTTQDILNGLLEIEAAHRGAMQLASIRATLDNLKKEPPSEN